jgi:DNA-binding MarR family transcriptional regulator
LTANKKLKDKTKQRSSEVAIREGKQPTSVSVDIFNLYLYMEFAYKIATINGLSFGEVVVLKNLVAQQDFESLGEIHRSIKVLSGASISKIANRLLSKGLAEMRIDPDSHRRKIIKVTQAGRKVFSNFIEQINTLVSGFLKNILLEDADLYLKVFKGPIETTLGISRYQEIIDRIEDLQDLQILERMREKPLRFKRLSDVIKEYDLSV